MTYHVEWDQRAEGELAAVWLAATDRAAVTAAVAWFDHQLKYAPLRLGRRRTASVNRVAWRDGLGIEFEVIEDDKRVIVQAVFAVKT